MKILIILMIAMNIWSVETEKEYKNVPKECISTYDLFKRYENKKDEWKEMSERYKLKLEFCIENPKNIKKLYSQKPQKF